MAKAIIAGASGLIGGLLLDILLQSPAYQNVTILVRKPLPIEHVKLKQLIVDFAQLDKYAGGLKGHVIFSCLGTTRKLTPDMALYRKIDHDYPVQLAQLAKKNGIAQFHLVSSLGANPKAKGFYPKLKGETERDVTAVGLSCLHIYQPSLLTGREKNRSFEEDVAIVLMKMINPLLIGSTRKYRSIPAKTVALAMYKQSLLKQEGVFVHPSDNIKEIA